MNKFDLEWDEELVLLKTERYCEQCMIPMHIHPRYGDIIECPKCREIYKEPHSF